MKKITKNRLIAITILMFSLLISQSIFAQCNVLFILDDSGSINPTERADMTYSVQKLADEIEANNVNVEIGIVQYSYSRTEFMDPRFYHIESGFVSNPIIQNIVRDTTTNDHLPAAIAEMEADGLFSSGGIYETTGAIFIFTDASRQNSVVSILEQFASGSDPGGICKNYNFCCNSSPNYEEYSDLSSSLGGIPISVYRVKMDGGSAAGMVQGGGIIIAGATDFKMSPAQITAFAQNINIGCIPTDNCAGAIINSTIETSQVTCGSSNVTASVSVSGGTAPYTYVWSNMEFTATVTNLQPGTTYYVSITDANGCRDSLSVNIIQSYPVTTSTTVNNESCNGASDGSATIQVNSGTAPYIYQWSDGQTTQVASGLAPGTYTVVVTDANGCMTDTQVTVESFVNTINLENLTIFELYPNPSDGQFIINVQFSVTETANLSIFSELGQQVYNYTNTQNSFTQNIDISQHAAGTYFVMVSTDKGRAIKKVLLLK